MMSEYLTDGFTDELQDLLELLSATKNLPKIFGRGKIGIFGEMGRKKSVSYVHYLLKI